ncbi:rCG25755, partial [Rattus norvegicus]
MRKGNLASTSPCHPRLSEGRDIVIKITSLLLIVFGKLAFLACVVCCDKCTDPCMYHSNKTALVSH